MVKAGQRLEVTLCADNDFYSQQVGKGGEGGRERETRERERERENRERERIEKDVNEPVPMDMCSMACVCATPPCIYPCHPPLIASLSSSLSAFPPTTHCHLYCISTAPPLSTSLPPFCRPAAYLFNNSARAASSTSGGSSATTAKRSAPSPASPLAPPPSVWERPASAAAPPSRHP